MAIKAPAWVEKTGAAPTLRGWEVNGELIKASKHTQAQLDEYWGVSSEPEPTPEPTPEPIMPAPEVDAPADDMYIDDVEIVDLSKMTKAQLIEFAESAGVEVDPKDTKAMIIDTINGA